MTNMKSNVDNFLTETGIEVPSVNSDQMRELDRIAVQETGPSLLQMMENAGRNLALLALELMGSSWRDARVAVLAGSGGNGGGGICAARHLSNHGVLVYLSLAEPNRLSQAAAAQMRTFQCTDGKLVSPNQVEGVRPDLILDALIGYGLNASPRGVVEGFIDWTNRTAVPVLSLDVPSGIDATTGQTPGKFVRPAWTLTLALPKSGLLGAETGQLFLADIGIPAAAFRRVVPRYEPPFGKRNWVALKRGHSVSASGQPLV